MAESEKVERFILTTLRERMNLPIPERVAGDTALGAEGLDLESLALVELTVHLENEFGVSFEDDEYEEIAKLSLADFSNEVSRRAVAGKVASDH